MGITTNSLFVKFMLCFFYNLSSIWKTVFDRADYAFKPKDVNLDKKINISPIDDKELSESEIKARLNRLTILLQNKVVTPIHCNIQKSFSGIISKSPFWVSYFHLIGYGLKATWWRSKNPEADCWIDSRTERLESSRKDQYASSYWLGGGYKSEDAQRIESVE